MNSKIQDDSKKQPNHTKKPKNPRVRKKNPQKQGKKRPPKTTKQTQPRHIPVKKPDKPSNQNKVEAQKTEVEFVSKATIEEEWTIETIDRYVLAVRKAFEKIPETEKGEIDLREIWVNSSLPADLILKIINEHGEKLGITKNSLYLDGKMIY
ncbi:MAG: hypothetical protein ACOC34_00935 [Thermotogota bacterium]